MNTRIQMATPTSNFERARKRRIKLQAPIQSTPETERRLTRLLTALAVVVILALAVHLS